MKIISAPHPTLRQVAAPVQKFDRRLQKFIKQLSEQMLKEKDPEGVGLAAPQINKSWQIFVARVGDNPRQSRQITAFINPQIVEHAPKKTLLADADHFEGCLSVPKVYGPVPRWDWLVLKYQTLDGQGQVAERQEEFTGFAARVIQHEYDHLQGVLFTDYLLSENLPAYVAQKNEWLEIEDRQILEAF